jgi:hypothetical protein
MQRGDERDTHLHRLRCKQHAQLGRAVNIVVHDSIFDLPPEESLNGGVGQLIVDRLWEELGLEVELQRCNLFVHVLRENLS